MRLLNATSRTLKTFDYPETPPYVILSHTWGEGEVSYQDISGQEYLFRLKGYEKISLCCRQALSDGYDWVWIDTCCIDKTSSAELSEAINSMFQWYKKAEICYAYLSDFDSTDWVSELAKSRWFTRGWTLQELIAPADVIFYDSKWIEVGTKHSLSWNLSEITGINARVLDGDKCDRYSVACRMSWASKRVTTRLEDEAYCLMGIFGVNMPLLYGEGNKAFFRLQEEIMKGSDDHSLFAWITGDERRWPFTGLLADSPHDFLGSGDVERLVDDSQSLPYSITNKGVQLTLPIVEISSTQLAESLSESNHATTFLWRPPGIYNELTPLEIKLNYKVVLLNCHIRDVPISRIGLLLTTTSQGTYHADTLRVRCRSHLVTPRHLHTLMKTEVKTIYIGVPNVDDLLSNLYITKSWDPCCCTIRTIPSETGAFRMTWYPSDGVWKNSGSIIHLNLESWADNGGFVAMLIFEDQGFGFAVLWQRRNSRLYADVVEYRRGEHPRDILARFGRKPSQQDRITCEYKYPQAMSQEKVIFVSVNIKKCPGGQVADLSIQTNLLQVY